MLHLAEREPGLVGTGFAPIAQGEGKGNSTRGGGRLSASGKREGK